MKSWSMIRSMPGLGEPLDLGARLVGRAVDPAQPTLLEPRLAGLGVGPEGREQRPLALHDLVLGPPDEHAGHRRSGQRRRIAADRPARLVELAARPRPRASGDDELRLYSSA